jgi:hypothetical protein
MTQLQAHTIAAAWPKMPPDRFAELVESIRSRGLSEDIVLYEGQILDGVNRYKACLEAESPPRTRQYGDRVGDGDDPVDFAIIHNQIHRDALSGEDKVNLMLNLKPAVEAEAKKRQLSNLKQGTETRSPLPPIYGNGKFGTAARYAAEAAGVSERQAQRLFRVADSDQAQELMPAVRSGEMSINKAEALVKAGKNLPSVIVISPLEEPDEEFLAVQAEVREAWQALKDIYKAWEEKYAKRMRDVVMGREVYDTSRKIASLLSITPIYLDTDKRG